MRNRLYSSAFVLFFVAFAATSYARADATPHLVRYTDLAPNVAFWKKIFVHYTSRQAVFHDRKYLDLVYSIADLGDIVDSGRSSYRIQRALRTRMRAETHRIDAVLERIAAGSRKTDEERRLAALISKKFGSVAGAAELVGRVRPQRGLGHQFCAAMQRAWPYLPAMREILWRHGVPEEVAALPLVESSYRSDAMSYAGAVGMWQFTRTTGRRFLRIDYAVDERRDPLRATEAAARYLRQNYELLGTWPLAITAYNHGEAGMERAVRVVGTTDFSIIQKQYKSRSFGFASANFYAELLAAADVVANAGKVCPGLDGSPDFREQVTLDHFVSMSRLASCAGMSTTELARWNPALLPDVVRGKLWVPRSYELTVPAAAKKKFTAAYASLPSSALRTAQVPYHATHRVARGQTLSQIAQMYRTSVRSLKTYNHISDPRRLRSGQVIKVPFPRRVPPVKATSTKPFRIHRVQKGQTLSGIAQLYRTSVHRLKSTNGIRDPRHLRYGQRLRIPN